MSSCSWSWPSASASGSSLLSEILGRTREAKGLDASLVDLARQPLGSVALIVVAVGFGLFGVFCFIAARHART